MLQFRLRMIKRYFFQDKKFVINNTIGLTLAFTSILFIYSWIKYERSFDTYYENSSRIFRFTIEDVDGPNSRHFARVSRNWLKEFSNFFPEVEEMVRLAPGRNSSLKIGQNRFYSQGVFSADSNFFSVFNVDLISGNRENALDAPKCAVINQSIAQKYFGESNPIGKEIEWSHQQGIDFYTYTVKGVMPDFPKNSHFHPEILLSFDDPLEYNQWFYTYLLLKKNTDVKDVKAQFQAFRNLHLNETETSDQLVFHLQNVADIHLYSHKDREIEPNGDARSILVLSIVGFILLVVISLNYMNFQIASVLERNTFYNVSKILGAKRREFIVLLALESSLLVFISSVISLMVYIGILPLLANWLQIGLLLSASEVVVVYFLVLLFFIFLGIVCSIYPVFLLQFKENINVLKIFKTEKNRESKEFSVRKVLMILQFVGGICLIIATSVIIKQNQYLLSNRVGGGQDNIINLIKLPKLAVDNYKLFKHELLSHPEILDVTASMEEPAGEVMDAFTYELEGMPEEDKNKVVYILTTDFNFNRFYENELLAGEDFNDVVNSGKYIINEAALKLFGYSNPHKIVGKGFKSNIPVPDFFKEGRIIGVINDFHITTMQSNEKPIVLYFQPYFNYCFGIKFDPNRVSDALATISSAWQKVNPDFALQSYFIDELYFKLYKNQIRQSKFLSLLAFIVLFISCMGLFSLAVYNIKKRTKEIGIRKVNGAKTSEVIVLLNQTFIKWVVISFVIATPIAWWAMDIWLQNFANKTSLSWWIFVGAGLLVMGIALLTVSLQSWKAALRNPVEALRYE